MAKPAVIIIGADKGGVGKTTVSRTLLDYFNAHQVPTRAFDTEAPRGTLKRFYPDTTAAHSDKRNVRDGHYVPWSYTEYITKVDEAGDPVNSDVERILDIVRGDPEVRLQSADGVAPAFDIDALEVLAKKGLVPDCAMQVSRERDGGDLSLYSPAAPCGCFYESVVDPDLKSDEAWQARCQTCDGECDSGVCTNSFDMIGHPVCSVKCTPPDSSTCPSGSEGMKCNTKGYCKP